MTHLIETSRVHEARQQHDFGLQDKEARAFGARIDLFTVELRSDPPVAHSKPLEGIRYAFDGRVVLGGELFGHGRTMHRYFASREEREATIAQYLFHARERIRKRIKQQQLAEARRLCAAKDAAIAAKRKARRAIDEEAAMLVAAALIERVRSHAAQR